MKLERPIAWIDIESTGVDVVKDRIIEFAAIVMGSDGTIAARWIQRFNPGIPIPPEATECHGITDEDVKDCPVFNAEWGGRILRGLAGKDIGGYNLRHMDLPMLDEELRRHGMKLDLQGVAIIDCFGIFRKKDPRDLASAVAKYCGGKIHEGAHGADADATATAEVFLGQLGAYPDLAEMSVGQLAEFSRGDENVYADVAGKLYFNKEGEVCYAFGKHKGKRVLDERGYAIWMLDKGEFPGSTRDVLKQVLGLA